MPRLEPLPPSALSSEQRELQERMLASTRKNLKGFTSERETVP